MGMYTELHFYSELRSDAPQEVIDVLVWMAGGDGKEPPAPDHQFFDCDRWRVLFRMDSAYFDAKTHSEVFQEYEVWFLNVRSNLKNYDGEIEKFIDWVRPYLAKEPGEFLGFSRYEESETPTLIYA